MLKWIGCSVGTSIAWYRDRPGGVARNKEIQGQRHAAHMLQECGLGSSKMRGLLKLAGQGLETTVEYDPSIKRQHASHN